MLPRVHLSVGALWGWVVEGRVGWGWVVVGAVLSTCWVYLNVPVVAAMATAVLQRYFGRGSSFTVLMM